MTLHICKVCVKKEYGYAPCFLITEEEDLSPSFCPWNDDMTPKWEWKRTLKISITDDERLKACLWCHRTMENTDRKRWFNSTPRYLTGGV
jgi:hypothetical protein